MGGGNGGCLFGPWPNPKNSPLFLDFGQKNSKIVAGFLLQKQWPKFGNVFFFIYYLLFFFLVLFAWFFSFFFFVGKLLIKSCELA